jgi:5-methylcytosine-specific restriction endonuclease McrA
MMSQVLLLNATYEPIRVIPIRRALSLIVAAKVEVVEETEDHIRSARESFRVPSVVKLVTFVRVPFRTKLPLTRANLMARDRGRCQYCGRAGDTVDHVFPRSRGGRHEWANVVIACRPCNGRKANRLLSELGWNLSAVPKAPKGTAWVVVGLARPEPAWAPYLGTAA